VADIGKDRSEGSIRAHSYKDAVERLMSDLPDVSKSEKTYRDFGKGFCPIIFE
jgi:hypothetical protein